MTYRRTTSKIIVAAVGALAVAAPALGEPTSRDYPATYSSRKAPWYDPFGWFTASDKKVIPTNTTDVKGGATPVIEAPPGTGPAWKWYGYGTPTPGANPYTPNGQYPNVPANWHASSGTTPGAIPGRADMFPSLPPGIAPIDAGKPIPHLPKISSGDATSITMPPSGPRLGAPESAYAPKIGETEAQWKSASIGVPTKDAGSPKAIDNGKPSAFLKAPVAQEAKTPDKPVAPSIPVNVSNPTDADDGPDIPVIPAEGIKPPPPTVRGRAPEPIVPDGVLAAIRRSSGSDIRVLEVARSGKQALILRFSAPNLDAARAARARLAEAAELAGWRIEFDWVTLLRQK